MPIYRNYRQYYLHVASDLSFESRQIRNSGASAASQTRPRCCLFCLFVSGAQTPRCDARPGVPRMWTRGPHAQNAGPRITARRLCAEARRKQHLGRVCDAAEGFEGLRRIANAPQVRLRIDQFIPAPSIIIGSALTQGQYSIDLRSTSYLPGSFSPPADLKKLTLS